MKKIALSCTFTVLLGTVALLAVPRETNGEPAASPAPAAERLSAHVFEQRIYTTAPGKLPNLHARFRDHTNYLFVKHGMQLIGYWTPVDKENTLIYILAYPSLEARAESWKGFRGDPEWQRVSKESKENAGGTIVTKVESTLMEPTDYSPIR